MATVRVKQLYKQRMFRVWLHSDWQVFKTQRWRRAMCLRLQDRSSNEWCQGGYIHLLYTVFMNMGRITVDNLPGNQRKHLHTATATEAALLEMLRLYAADILMSYEWVQSTDCKSVMDICRLQLFSHFLFKNKQKELKEVRMLQPDSPCCDSEGLRQDPSVCPRISPAAPQHRCGSITPPASWLWKRRNRNTKFHSFGWHPVNRRSWHAVFLSHLPGCRSFVAWPHSESVWRGCRPQERF